ncbi:MAG: hypothetical protein LRY61_07030 [Burkholderiaceae bacterium]|nr:hypothetical protein [Burkholderiaceae bacterium]
MQILSGTCDKTKRSIAQQAITAFAGKTHYAMAEDTEKLDAHWVVQQWDMARELQKSTPSLLVLDNPEIIPRWSDAVKMLWDQDTFAPMDTKTNSDLQVPNYPLHVVLLCSPDFLIRPTITESMVGRFELIRCQ